MKTILLTNDDGIHAPGILALHEALKPLGRLLVVAPDRDNSAVSHALTLHRPLRVRELKTDFFSVNGTPTDCVTLAIGKMLSAPPSMVVSGINAGANLGDDLTYSGTVSAAMEGTMLGVPSLAVSLAGEEPFQFEMAAAQALKIAEYILQHGLPRDTLLNVNIPNGDIGAITGVEFTCQGRRVYDGAIQETFDPWGRKHFWIGGGTPLWEKRKGTDAQAILAGKISITPIHLDLTNHQALAYLKSSWKHFEIITETNNASRR